MRKQGLRTGLVMFTLLLISTGIVYAQDDPGCKDHPLLSRMPGFYIDSCEKKDFDQYTFADSQGKEVPVEGTYHFIKYVLNKFSKERRNLCLPEGEKEGLLG